MWKNGTFFLSLQDDIVKWVLFAFLDPTTQACLSQCSKRLHRLVCDAGDRTTLCLTNIRRGYQIFQPLFQRATHVFQSRKRTRDGVLMRPLNYMGYYRLKSLACRKAYALIGAGYVTADELECMYTNPPARGFDMATEAQFTTSRLCMLGYNIDTCYALIDGGHMSFDEIKRLKRLSDEDTCRLPMSEADRQFLHARRKLYSLHYHSPVLRAILHRHITTADAHRFPWLMIRAWSWGRSETCASSQQWYRALQEECVVTFLKTQTNVSAEEFLFVCILGSSEMLALLQRIRNAGYISFALTKGESRATLVIVDQTDAKQLARIQPKSRAQYPYDLKSHWEIVCFV